MGVEAPPRSPPAAPVDIEIGCVNLDHYPALGTRAGRRPDRGPTGSATGGGRSPISPRSSADSSTSSTRSGARPGSSPTRCAAARRSRSSRCRWRSPNRCVDPVATPRRARPPGRLPVPLRLRLLQHDGRKNPIGLIAAFDDAVPAGQRAVARREDDQRRASRPRAGAAPAGGRSIGRTSDHRRLRRRDDAGVDGGGRRLLRVPAPQRGLRAHARRRHGARRPGRSPPRTAATSSSWTPRTARSCRPAGADRSGERALPGRRQWAEPDHAAAVAGACASRRRRGRAIATEPPTPDAACSSASRRGAAGPRRPPAWPRSARGREHARMAPMTATDGPLARVRGRLAAVARPLTHRGG